MNNLNIIKNIILKEFNIIKNVIDITDSLDRNPNKYVQFLLNIYNKDNVILYININKLKLKNKKILSDYVFCGKSKEIMYNGYIILYKDNYFYGYDDTTENLLKHKINEFINDKTDFNCNICYENIDIYKEGRISCTKCNLILCEKCNKKMGKNYKCPGCRTIIKNTIKIIRN
jgi:hypothetical protein